MTEQEIQSVMSRFIADAFIIKRWCKKHDCEECILAQGCPKLIFNCFPDSWETGPNITDDDETILRNIAEAYKWIACDRDGGIWGYRSRPSKGECRWHTDGETGKVLSKDMLPNLFRWCTWEDDEPWHIPSLLG